MMPIERSIPTLIEGAMPSGPPIQSPGYAWPASLTPLVGREHEATAVHALLLRDDVPLVTLTGPGGVGKTRLALEVASAAAPTFGDGVQFVALAPIRDADRVAVAIVRALGVQQVSDQPGPEILGEYLRQRQMLLVLDNFEQVLAAALMVAHLLTTCPGVKVLITSRTPLHLSGEHEYPVAPLALPDPEAVGRTEDLAGNPAVKLFLARASAAYHAFATAPDTLPAVAHVCRRLDGLPLAIELAAARSRVLSPESMLSRLERRLPLLTGGPRDLPARLRTMSDAIRWSYDLLEEDEQRLFRRLAVFVGGFTIDAAEAVANSAGPLSLDVFEGIASLIDKSLIQPTGSTEAEPRFVMLETIREFALDRLQESGEAEATCRAHADRFRTLAEVAAPALLGPSQVDWLRRLDDEHYNLRGALLWTVERGEPEPVFRFVTALWLYWFVRGEITEGRLWLRRALDMRDPVVGHLRAAALTGAGALAATQGDHAASETILEEAVRQWRDLGDRSGTAQALSLLGYAAFLQTHLHRAATLFQEALDLYQEPEDETWIGLTLDWLGVATAELGDSDRAVTLCEEALTRQRATGNRLGIAIGLLYLAEIVSDRGDPDRAIGLYREAIGLLRELGDKWLLAVCLIGTAAAATSSNQPQSAVRLLGASRTLFEAVRVPTYPRYLARYERAVAAAKSALGETAFANAWEAGRALALEQAVSEARAVPMRTDPALPAAPTPPENLGHGLTRRELEVLRLVAAGCTDREIAVSLFVSHRTASTHVAHILAKLEVDSRTGAVVYALRRGLV